MVEFEGAEEACDSAVCEPVEKQPRYLAIYKTSDEVLSYVTAPTGQALKKLLEEVPVENIVTVWKGRSKEIKVKSALSF